MQEHVAVLLSTLEEVHGLPFGLVFHFGESFELCSKFSADLHVIKYVVNKVLLVKKCDVVKARVAVHVARFDEVF